MKIRISHLALLILSATLFSFSAVAQESNPDNLAVTTETASGDSTANKGAAVQTSKENNDQETTTENIAKARTLPLELILSCLALLAAVVVFLLDRSAIKKEKRYLVDRINQRKTEHFELESRVNQLEKDIPRRVRLALQEQQELFMAEQERKMQAMREEAAAREEELRRQQEAIEEANKPHAAKTWYASYKGSVKGFAVDFLSEDKKSNSTAIITTKSDDEAEFVLVPDVNPTAFRNVMDACEIVKGTPESYNIIEIVEPGQLKLDDDAWVIVSKVKIACV